jgi:hypothetical protein
MAMLIETVETAPKTDFLLRRDILSALRRMLQTNTPALRLFRESGGLVCLVSVLASLENGTRKHTVSGSSKD